MCAVCWLCLSGQYGRCPDVAVKDVKMGYEGFTLIHEIPNGIQAHLQFYVLCVYWTRDYYSFQVSSSKQSIALLRQDKDYLNRQVTDLTHRTAFCEEKLQQVNMQLDDAKKAREEMYEKYVESR